MSRKSIAYLAVGATVLAGMLVVQPGFAQGRKGGGGGGGGGGGRGGRGGAATNNNAQQQQQLQQQQQQKQQANAARTAAQSDDAKAAAALGDLVKKLTTAFQNTPDYLKASRAVAEASLAYEATKVPVLAALPDSNAKYKLTKAKLAAAEAKYAKMKDEGAEDVDMKRQGEIVFTLGNQLGPIEQAAIEEDPDAIAAKKQLDAVMAAVNKLMDDFRAKLAENPDYVAAKQAKDDAEKKLAALK